MTSAQCSEVSLEFNRHIVNLLDSLSALSELAALSIHDFDEAHLLKHALEALMANQDMERCSIFLLDERNELVNVAGLDWHAMLETINRDDRIDAPPYQKGTHYRYGEGIMGRAAQTAEIQHCRSCADDPHFSAYGQLQQSIQGSLICVPIVCERRVLGVLNVFHPDPGFFNSWHERLLLLFCQLLGRLLTNHRFAFRLNALLDEKTRETQATNAALAVEILQRKAAFEQLDEQRQFLQNVIDSIPDPVMVIGADYRLLMANAVARSTSAVPSPSGTELTCHLVSHGSERPCDGESHQCPLHMVRETRAPVSLTHVHRGPGGEPRYVELNASPLHDRAGDLIGIVESTRDITERKRSEKRLREIERRMRALLDANSESSILLGPTGDILAINSVAAGRFGKSPAEMLHCNFFSYLPVDLARRRREVFDQAIVQQQPLVTRDRRGSIEFETHLSPVLNDAGEVESVAIYARDITEQQRVQAIDALFHRLDLMLLKWRMDMKTIAQMFCDEIVRLFDLSAAWIGQAESDGSLLFVAAAETGDAHLLEVLRGQCQRWDGGEFSCPPAERAIREGMLQKVTPADPQCAACRDKGPPSFSGATLVLPLMLRGSQWGVLALYARDAQLFERADIPPRLVSVASRLCVSIEASLQQEWLALLDTAVASAGNAVFITDANGRIRWANPAFIRLSGYALEEIVGKSPGLFKSGEHDADFYRRFWQTIQSGNAWQGEVVNLRSDGTRYIVSQTVTPLKDVNGQIGHYVSVLEDITDRKAKEARIEYLANFDTLTALPNRSLLFDRLRQAIAMARREGSVGALLFLDLDGFKAVNDRFGHETGDLLLQAVAARLRQQVRESDTVARLGGDEFVLILPVIATIDDALQVAEKVFAAIGQPFDLDGKEAVIGLSIGIARFPADGDTIEALIGAADQAMYQAKHAGRGRVHVHRGDTRGPVG